MFELYCHLINKASATDATNNGRNNIHVQLGKTLFKKFLTQNNINICLKINRIIQIFASNS